MISTKGLKDGDLCMIAVGDDEEDENTLPVRIKVRFQNGLFVAEGNGIINGSFVHDGEIYGSSVIAWSKIECQCPRYCDYMHKPKKCAAFNKTYAWCKEWREKENQHVKKE